MATRAQLEHAIRAATTIVSHDRILIIGSQSVLGTWSEGDLPPEAVESIEFDACPLNDDDAESLATCWMVLLVNGRRSTTCMASTFKVSGVARQFCRLAGRNVSWLLGTRTLRGAWGCV